MTARRTRLNPSASVADVSTVVAAQDIPGQVTDALNADGTVAAALAAAVPAAVTAEVAGRDLVETTSPLVLQPGLLPTDPAYAIIDADNRLAFAIWSDGTVRIYKLDLASVLDGSLTAAKLSSTVQSQLVPAGTGAMFETFPSELAGYAWAIIDSTGRIGLGIKTDGTVVGKIPVADASVTAAKLDAGLVARIPPGVWALPVLPEVTGTTPSRKLYALSQTTGVRALVTDVGDPHDAIEDNGAILFTTTSGRFAYLSSGLTVPAFPDRSVFACWGDSMTGGYPPSEFPDASYAYPAKLDLLISASVVNEGIAGGASDEIAIRQGGYVLNLTVAGGSIPTSGPVTVNTTQAFGFRYDRSFFQAGTLNGVAGLLTRESTDAMGTMTFTRTSSGSAVASAGTYQFISTDAVSNESHPVVLFAGRNDIGYSGPAGMANPDPVSRVLNAYDAMVARLRAYHKEFLIISTLTTTAELSGTGGYVQVAAINNALSAKFGARYLDLRNYLVTQVIYDLGITPTSGDLTNIAADTLPPSIMASGDATHYSAATAIKVAAKIKTKLDQLGWTL